MLFVAVTGEEKGLLGSRFFANFPTVDPKAIVADINTDMFLPLLPAQAADGLRARRVGPGRRRGGRGEVAGHRAQPDPEPKRNIFIRSDQYSFIRQGIPSLMLKVGLRQGLARGSTSPRSG